ncbi:MAG: acyl-CoA dehydratase activase [Dehalococcoidia bacterium]
MITAGIDLGSKMTKIVVLKDNEILGRRLAAAGGFDRANCVEQSWYELLQQVGLSASDMSKVVATGVGKWDVSFADEHVVEPLADVQAALWLFSTARTVIDLGADQARVIKFDKNGKVLDYVLNQKCAAGLGTFAESIARALEVTLDEMSELSSKSNSSVQVNSECAVYAGLDVVSLLHDKTDKADISRAVNEAIAVKLAAMVNEMTIEKDVVLIGGMANNGALVSSLKSRLDVEFLIPEEPEFAGALGAALIAASWN